MCLAWDLIYASRICLDCYNVSAKSRRRPVGECGACRRVQVLKNGYCRLCWCQAREDRVVAGGDARSLVMIAPHLPHVRIQQLFLAGVHGKHWLAWALHLAHTLAEARGWKPTAQRAMQRVLVRLFADHREPDRIRASDLRALTAQKYINLDHVVEILTAMDVLNDDRPAALENLMAAKVAELPDTWRHDLLTWARLLRDGGPRSRSRHEQTVRAYLAVAADAAASWPQRGHLREVTRDDVLAYLGTLRGTRREIAATALRALFRWAKHRKLIFRNPAHAISIPTVPDPIWQPLRPEEITASVAAATTPQARLCVILAAVHAARPGQIRALHLDDVDLAQRRITIAGNSRPLDELTTHALLDWLAYRRERWPGTANPHLLVSTTSALGHASVSATWILNLRGLPGTLERLRIDRQLEEAIAAGADPLHLAAVFGFSEGTAIRWATNARQLFTDPLLDAPN